MARVLNNEKYEALVYDTSAQIAGKNDDMIVPALEKYITDTGFAVLIFQTNILTITSTIWEKNPRELFRGQMVDEGVYEEIKEIMRVIHDREIFDEGPVPSHPMHKMHPETFMLLCGRQDNPVFTLGHGCSIYWKDVDCPDCLAKKPESET